MLTPLRRKPPESPPVDKGADPEMQMNAYNMSELLTILQAEGVRDVWLELTDHGGALGSIIYFQRPVPAAGARPAT